MIILFYYMVSYYNYLLFTTYHNYRLESLTSKIHEFAQNLSVEQQLNTQNQLDDKTASQVHLKPPLNKMLNAMMCKTGKVLSFTNIIFGLMFRISFNASMRL